MAETGRHQITGEPRQPGTRELGPVGLPKAAAEATQGHAVQAAQRGAEQHPRLVGVRPAVAEGDLQPEQQRSDRGLGREGDLVAGDLDGDLGGGQRAAQPGDHPLSRPDQHGHL